MNGTTALINLGQRLWLDTISRPLLDAGRLDQYIDAYGITGVTSNPTILNREITGSDDYDHAMAASLERRITDPEQLVYEWAVNDAQRAADLLRPTWETSSGLRSASTLASSPPRLWPISATFCLVRRWWT